MKNIMILLMILIQYGCANDNYYYKNNQKIDLIPTNNISRSVSNIDYYQNNQGIILGVTNKLILKLKDSKYLDSVLSEFNITLEKTLSNNMYLLRTTNKSLTIDISNQLTERDYVKYAHPDFIKRIIKR